ncbi:hypothetical protein K1719_039646 [Acacia pycnantha]|nr:hypothetical protein K1719_039646 [Acacia pycnantha]
MLSFFHKFHPYPLKISISRSKEISSGGEVDLRGLSINLSVFGGKWLTVVRFYLFKSLIFSISAMWVSISGVAAMRFELPHMLLWGSFTLTPVSVCGRGCLSKLFCETEDYIFSFHLSSRYPPLQC